MTRFILHGGYTNVDNEQNSNFWRELSQYTPDGGNILLVNFSRKDDEMNKYFEEDKNRILKEIHNKKFIFSLASKENFMEQIKIANTIYMRGGNTEKLLDTLKQYHDFSKSLTGKVVSGDSAGAYVLAKYYPVSNGKVNEGLGILPIRIICHYENPRFEFKNDLLILMEQYPKDLELVILRDFEYRVFTVLI